jgi:glycosyltransferase involved in cell wall biosynthesis
MVIVPDRLSALVAKGEITERYYNPGDLFEEVHLVVMNDDKADPEALSVTVGRADLVLHNVPPPRKMFVRTLAFRQALVRRWARAAVELARRVRPELVRCHGAWLSAFLGAEIKRVLGVPYVVSVHNIPTEDVLAGADVKTRLRRRAMRPLEEIALRNADLVLPVYETIVPYLRRLGVTRSRVAYNALNPGLQAKDDCALHDPARVISVGRLIGGKNPEHLIRAAATLADVQLTVVGDGDLYDYLRAVADEAGGRVLFRRAVPNDELCRLLREQDIFATHNDYWGLPKAVMEAMLVGLPIVLNRRQGEPIPELPPEAAIFVDDTTEGYARALRTLLDDDAEREARGRRAAEHAWKLWAPERAERAVADIYAGVMGLDPAKLS